MVVLLLILAALAVVFGVAVVLTGNAEGMSEEFPDRADTGIPRDRAMTPEDVIGLRFALAFRGYRMSEVDDALDRLAAELDARDAVIRELRGGGAVEADDDYDDEYEDADEPADDLSTWMRPAEPSFTLGAAAGAGAAGGLGAGEAQGLESEPPPVLADEPEPAPEPTPEPEPAPAAPAAESPIFGSMTSPLRPEVPEIPTYDPWSVTPRSRYTDGPEHIEVDDHDDEGVVESVTEHQTGYAPPPAEATAAEDDEPPKPPWQR